MAADVVCFIPCCSSKRTGGGEVKPSYTWPDSGLESTWPKLESARRGMVNCYNDDNLSLTPALYLYSGAFYSAFDAGIAGQLIHSGKLRLFIISAGYGVLDAFELTRDYDAKMEGKVARYWRDAGLTGVVSDICLHLNPKEVYGFFAGQPVWSGAGAKYRYFFTAGVKNALKLGFKPEQAGCFHRQSGRGVTAILGALGRTFSSCLSSGLNCDGIVTAATTTGLRDGGIVIGYDDFTKA